jgi:hypothetical protein
MERERREEERAQLNEQEGAEEGEAQEDLTWNPKGVVCLAVTRHSSTTIR